MDTPAFAHPDLEIVAFKMDVVAGRLDDYTKRHDEIWPELAEALRAAGVVDYHIFSLPGGTDLFAVMWRRKDHGLDALSQTDLMRKWWSYMADVTQSDAGPVPFQYPLNEVFRLAQP